MNELKYFNIRKPDLIKGYILRIETIDKNDIGMSEVSFEDKRNRYYLWFNGKLIYSGKQFKALIVRLNKLDKLFPLEDDSQYI